MKKILLLHGWNYINYRNININQTKNPWHNRQGFVDLLKSSGFEIETPSFPGFVGYKYNDPESAWGMPEYVNYCDELVKKYNPDFILGYSFGGSVATMWKSKKGMESDIKIILVSPALERKYKKSTPGNFKLLKNFLPKLLKNIIRDLYLRFVAKNQYYSKGTKFLKGSYLNIVKIRCREDLNKIDPKQVLLIFGSNDTATPPEFLKNSLLKNSKILERIFIIQGGGHDIANTHTNQIVKKILKYTL